MSADRERPGRAGDLAARPGVVPALVAGRAARALRAGPAAGDGLRSGAGPSRSNVIALAAVLALCLVGLKLPLVGAGRCCRLAAVAARPGAARGPTRSWCGPTARAAAGGDHRRAARGGRPASSWPSARRSRWCRCWLCRSPRWRCSRRSPLEDQLGRRVRGLGRREDQAGRAAGGGDHRVLRQDLDQELRRAPDGRALVGAGEPGELQQRAGPGSGGQRPAQSRAPTCSSPRWAPTGPARSPRLCRLFPPEVSAITTIGEAHLERMKDRATRSCAPSPRSSSGPDDRAERRRARAGGGRRSATHATKRVIRCSATTEARDADVVVRRDADGWLLSLSGQEHRVALPAEVGHPINVAVAVGLALAVDVPEKAILDRLASVPATPHRAETTVLDTGVTVIDDTYNANPEGAAQALVSARSLVGEGGTVWTITPGMVELGSRAGAAQRRLRPGRRRPTRACSCASSGTPTGPRCGPGSASRTQVFGSRDEAARPRHGGRARR